MKLIKVSLDNSIVLGSNEFTFDDSVDINTISGINGSGKTTLFKSVILVQKAYFVQQAGPENASYDFPYDDYFEEVAKELFDILQNDKGFIILTLKVYKKDLTASEFLKWWGDEKNNSQNIEVTLLSKHYLKNDDGSKKRALDWEIDISERDNGILESFWNLKKPRQIIVYFPADRKVREKNVTFNDVKIIKDSSVSRALNVIMKEESLYDTLYERMINGYIRERLVPSKSGQTNEMAYFHKSKREFSYLMPDISIVNFSGNVISDQFILLAKTNKGKKYDVRHFSSGEKLIWYSLLLLNYFESTSLIIYDEPENHLHENLLWKFTYFLKDKCQNEDNDLSQVFLLTHSKNLIYNTFQSGKNYYIDDRKLTELSYENCEEDLRKIGISYVNEKVLFVEGDSDVKVLEECLGPYNITVKPLGGCSEIIKTYESIQRIHQYLHGNQIVFMIDRDTRSDEDIEIIAKADPEFFKRHFIILERREIESYFLESSYFCGALGDLWAKLNPDKKRLSKKELDTHFKELADDNRAATERACLNSLLHIRLKQTDDLIKESQIPIDSSDAFSKYLDSVFDGDKFKAKIEAMRSDYISVQERYSDEKWDKEWKSICDGKRVYHAMIQEMVRDIGVENSRIQRLIIDYALKSKEGPVNKLIAEIISMFHI